MKIMVGNLWDELGKADLILFTANSSIDSHGCLVMGAGAAAQAREHFPELPRLLGELISEYAIDGYYGWCSVRTEDGYMVGAFQAKYHWRDKSDLALIEQSCKELLDACGDYERIAMNFPGIGLGSLKESAVLPLLEMLPDNVFIYKNS